ncbi:MAG TPA: hypothetical protein VL025_06505 [Thermoanaerobaculia bacterium]|nr:hypothetical protein [Thermoanaerobaculia bacterium]
MASLVLAAALVIPAAPAQATEEGEAGEPVQAWEWLWQWVSEVLEPPGGLDGAKSDGDRGSHIDPNG